MPDTFTIAQAAKQLEWSYDYTRKRLSVFEPVDIIGKNKLYGQAQINKVKSNPAPVSPAGASSTPLPPPARTKRTGKSSVHEFLEEHGDKS